MAWPDSWFEATPEISQLLPLLHVDARTSLALAALDATSSDPHKK
jgi:hypothetical protein